jgi:hypothetical protein
MLFNGSHNDVYSFTAKVHIEDNLIWNMVGSLKPYLPRDLPVGTGRPACHVTAYIKIWM